MKYKVVLHPLTGIAQILFFKGEPCENPYSTTGKYQNQPNQPTPPQASAENQFKKQGSFRGEGGLQDTVRNNGDGDKEKSGKR